MKYPSVDMVYIYISGKYTDQIQSLEQDANGY